MTSKRFPGGWYVDALPSGEYAVLFADSHIETHAGRVPLTPAGNCLYLRIAPGKIAGQGQTGASNWEWRDGKWHELPAPYLGVNPVIYDKNGNLDINDGWAGSQGFRFIDERLYTGDETYLDASRGLNEWTRQGPLTVGIDNATDNCVLFFNNIKRRVLDGVCRFIRLVRSGSQYALSFYRPGDAAYVYWFTEAEIDQFPLFSTPTPEPRPEPPPVSIPNRFEVVQQIRAKYGTLTNLHQLGMLINEIAYTLRNDGFGLSAKPNGHHAIQPVTGRKIAADILHHRETNTLIDVLGAATGDDGSPGPANPAWGETPWHNDPINRPWVAPVALVSEGPIEEPPIEDPPPPQDLPAEAILARLEAILSAVNKLSNHLGVKNVV